jgi:hypothetical protein
MNVCRSELDSYSANAGRAEALSTGYLREIMEKGHLRIVEPAYETYRTLAERIDKTLSNAEDPAFLTEYAARMKLCLEHLNQLKQDIATLKGGGEVSFVRTAAALGYLGGELAGMNYTASKIQFP